jgi:hypothetical protein
MRPETADSVRAQVFSGDFEWVVGLHNPYQPVGANARNVLAQYQDARSRFLAGDYDALLTVEHDMVLPPDALQKLWDTDADVVYGLYMFRHGSIVLNAWEYIGGKNLGESLSLHPAKLEQARRKGVIRVSGCGFGCTLIRRPVLEAIEFRHDGTDQWSPDIPFAVDAQREGYISMARFDVPCGHYDGEVLIPAFGVGTMEYVTVTALSDVVAAGLRMRAGQQYTLLRHDASELARAGYVELQALEPETATLEAAENATKPTPRRKQK